jgi:hypothetical protein
MIKKLLLKLYLKSQREITSVSESEQYDLFKFGSREDMIRLLKVTMTQQTLQHWEAKDDEERQMAKGAAFLCKVLLDAHRMVMKIEEETIDPDKKLTLWQQFKKKFRVH